MTYEDKGQYVNLNLEKDNLAYQDYIPEMVLYAIGDKCFDTIDELLYYCRINKLSTEEFYVLAYYRNLFDRSDVIKKVNSKISLLFTVVDKSGYDVYNPEKSVESNKHVWNYNYGNVKKYYKFFREKGIVFENDFYAKHDDQMQELLEYYREMNSNSKSL